jgi:hypothetical protein
MWVLAAANYVLGIAIYVMGQVGYGIAATVSFSRLRGLEVDHAIQMNPTALQDIANAGLANPADIHSYLTAGFHSNLAVINAAAIALLLNGAIWTIAAWRSERTSPPPALPPPRDAPS